MYFLGRDETNSLAQKLRCQIADQPRPKLVLYYKSGDRDYSRAAKAITASVGEFCRGDAAVFVLRRWRRVE